MQLFSGFYRSILISSSSFLVIFSILIGATNKTVPRFADSESLALGGATVSLFGNGFALHQNPASLNLKTKSYDIVATINLSALDGIGLGIADSYAADLAVGISYHGLAPHGETNLNDLNSSHRAGIKFGYLIFKRLSIGLGAGLYKGAQYANTNVFFGFTPGVVLDLAPFSIGAMWKDIFTLNESGYASVLSAGASFSKDFFLVSLQGDYQFGKANFPDTVLGLRGGLGFRFKKFVALSGGFHNAYNVGTGVWDDHSFSLGVEYFIDYHRFYIANDYNFSKSEDTFSISYRFVPRF